MTARLPAVIAIISGLAACGSSAPTPSEPPADLKGFEYAGNLIQKRFWHTATLMNDGRVLVSGGAATDRPGHSSAALYHDSTELFDPETGTSSSTRNMSRGRVGDKGILLADGRVVILGAHLAPVEIYDPQSDRFSAHNATLGDIGTATLLPNGKILAYCRSDIALFDPDTGNFVRLPGSFGSRGGHTATLLQNGRILIVGGGYRGGLGKVAEIYEPTSNTFTSVGELYNERRGHKAVLLNDGRVLVIGGTKGDFTSPEPVMEAELYDPVTGTFSLVGSPGIMPIWAAAALHTGKVFLICGEDGNVVIYDPASGSFILTGDSIGPNRKFYSTTVLNDGRVLVAGGMKDGEATDHVLVYKP